MAGPLDDAIPKRDDLERVARELADLATLPIDIIVRLINSLEGFGKFALVGYALYYATRKEYEDNKTRKRRR